MSLHHILAAVLVASVLVTGCSDNSSDRNPVAPAPECPESEIALSDPGSALRLHRPLVFGFRGSGLTSQDHAAVTFSAPSGKDTTLVFPAGTTSVQFAPDELGLWRYDAELSYSTCDPVLSGGMFIVADGDCPPCWANYRLAWQSAVVPSGGWVMQVLTITIPGSAIMEPGSSAHWEGPETLEPSFFWTGTDQDGVFSIPQYFFGYGRDIGDWTVHVVLLLDCLEHTFVVSLPFVVLGETPASR